MQPRRLLITILAAVTALAPGLAAAAEDGPVHKNKEGAWLVRRYADGVCSAWMEIGDGGFLLNAHGGAFGVVASDGTKLKGKSAQVVTDVGNVPFKAAMDPDSGDLYADDLLDQDAVTQLKTARHIAVTLDGMLVVGFDTAGTGLPQLVDDLAACGRGEKGWWDAPEPPLPVNKEGWWTLNAEDGICVASVRNLGGVAFSLGQSPGGDRLISIKSSDQGRPDRATIANQDAWTALPLERDGDYLWTHKLDARPLYILRHAERLSIAISGKPLVDLKLQGTGYPQILDDLAACAAGKSGWWGDGAKPEAR